MSDTTEAVLQYDVLLTGIGGGLALFLYGMRKMTEALKTVAGSGIKNLLARLTQNRFTGMLSGALITATVQSSSVTTVLLVGFITAGLMTFSQSIGVIIGANIGTTITAQIIAFKVTNYALLLIGAGFLTELIAKSQKARHYGIMVMGLGLIFFGMELMADATSPLRNHQPFIDAMREMSNPLWGILIGLFFTALVQSSSATTGIIIVLSSQGFITLDSGIALLFGANIGTCITALLSAIGKPREALQAVTAHVLYNLIGVLLWVFFIPQFADLVRWVSFAGEVVDAEEIPRQIANAHTLFNVCNALLFIWFTTPLARLIEYLVPLRPVEDSAIMRPLFLDPMYLDQPAIAFDQVRRELERLGSMARQMVEESLPTILHGSEAELNRLYKADQHIDELHASIIEYLGALSLRDLVEGQPEEIYGLIAAANHLENIGDVVETNLIADGHKRLQQHIIVGEETEAYLQQLHEQVCRAVETALRALMHDNVEAAAEVKASKGEFNTSLEQVRVHLNRRLVADKPQRLDHFRIEVSIIDDLKRLHTLARRIADITLERHENNEEPA